MDFTKNYEDLGSVDSGRSIESVDLQQDDVSGLIDNTAERYSENPGALATTPGEGVSLL